MPSRRFVPEKGQIVILAATVWAVTFWNWATPGLFDRMGHVKGTDFLHFYTLGHVAQSERWSLLYEFEGLGQLGDSLVPGSRERFVPIYGPQVALAFRPLARLPYLQAYAVWIAVTTLIVGFGTWAAWRLCPAFGNRRLLIALAVAGSPAFLLLVNHGQNTPLALVSFALGGIAYRKGRDFLAGVAIGFLVYKPQLGVTAAIVFLLFGPWRLVAGAILAASLQLGVTWWAVGAAPMINYVDALRHAPGLRDVLMAKPYLMHCYRSFGALFLPAPVAFWLALVASVMTWLGLAVVWRRLDDRLWQWVLLSLVSVLTAVHLYAYDLVILLPAFLWAADWAVRHPDHVRTVPLRGWLLAVYLLPLLGPFAAVVGIQPSVVAMMGLALTAASIGCARPEPTTVR